MKARKNTCYFLVVIPLILNILSLSILPNKIPAHFDMNNVVDRWGSKFEILIIPVLIIIFGIVMMKVSQHVGNKDNESKNNQKMCDTCTIVALITLNILNLYIIFISFNKISDLNTLNLDLSTLLFTVLGLGMVVLGNLMPKSKLNSTFGLRTPWSMKNENLWKKSQLFGGIIFMLTGILIVICCYMTKGLQLYIACISLLFINLFVSVYYTYHISKKRT